MAHAYELDQEGLMLLLYVRNHVVIQTMFKAILVEPDQFSVAIVDIVLQMVLMLSVHCMVGRFLSMDALCPALHTSPQ